MQRSTFLKNLTLTGLGLLTQQLTNAGYISSYTTADVMYYTKQDAKYHILRKGFNKRINNYPDVIALCHNTAGVAAAVLYAKQRNLPITVKSGGHCMEGYSCTNGGMVINLSLLNNITVHSNNTITVGPAATLKQIYETLLPQGKYLPGGSCQSVAIGGLTLGGGYGILSRTYGLTCDSLLQATVVDGGGNIINTTTDAELLWACKGGGNNNFGTITSMSFTVYNAPSTLKSYKFRVQKVSIPAAVDMCKQWFEAVRNLPNSCFSAFIYNGRTTYILLTHTGGSNAIIQKFVTQFKNQSTKYTEGATLPLATALKAYYAEANPITFKNASAGLYKSYAQVEQVLEQVFTTISKSSGILYQVNTLGGAIQNAGKEGSSSFAHRDCTYFSELQAYWESASVTPKILAAFEAVQQLFAKHGITAQYRNYPDANFNNYEQLYYGKNLTRLKAIKKKYDPNNMYRGGHSITAYPSGYSF